MPDQPVAVRDARPADAPVLARILVESWRAAYRGLLPDAVLAGLSVTAAQDRWTIGLTDPPPRTATLVVEDAGRVVGFCGVGPPLFDEPDPAVGWLYTLYLQPDRWGRGLGRLLHDAAVERLEALGCTAATLWVLDGNERAIGFYRGAGWAADGAIRTDIGPGGVELRELRMRRRLKL